MHKVSQKTLSLVLTIGCVCQSLFLQLNPGTKAAGFTMPNFEEATLNALAHPSTQFSRAPGRRMTKRLFGLIPHRNARFIYRPHRVWLFLRDFPFETILASIVPLGMVVMGSEMDRYQKFLRIANGSKKHPALKTIRYVRAEEMTRQERLRAARSLRKWDVVEFNDLFNRILSSLTLTRKNERASSDTAKRRVEEARRLYPELRLAVDEDGAVLGYIKIGFEWSVVYAVEVRADLTKRGIGLELCTAAVYELFSRSPVERIVLHVVSHAMRRHLRHVLPSSPSEDGLFRYPGSDAFNNIFVSRSDMLLWMQKQLARMDAFAQHAELLRSA